VSITEQIKSLIESRVLVIDGAMGTPNPNPIKSFPDEAWVKMKKRESPRGV